MLAHLRVLCCAVQVQQARVHTSSSWMCGPWSRQQVGARQCGDGCRSLPAVPCSSQQHQSLFRHASHACTPANLVRAAGWVTVDTCRHGHMSKLETCCVAGNGV